MAMNLDQTKLYAQRQANSQGITLTIWNLNRFNPLYVVRNYRAGDEDKPGFVQRFYPEAIVR
jgi:hypothetical protein